MQIQLMVRNLEISSIVRAKLNEILYKEMASMYEY